jgi:ribosomal protein L40E
MTIKVQTCPRCNALVMSDAAECHLCHYEFDRQKSTPHGGGGALPSDAAVADDLEICPKCGETNRTGVVRCSSCGAFTRAEIGAEFRKRQERQEAAGPYTPHSFDLPEFTESREFQNLDELMPSGGAGAGTSDDADFVLTASDADFEFELADQFKMAEDTSAPRAKIPVARTEELPPPTAPKPTAPASDAKGKATEAPAPENTDGKRAAAEAESGIPHSEATGGEALLRIAQQEEADIQQVKRTYREKVRGGFVVYCPMGCRIRVAERHRGKTGKCPRCGSLFVVPLKSAPKAAPKADEAAAAGAAADAGVFGKWSGWMVDVHAHAVVPQKLKIKADSLLKEYQNVDLAFSDEGLLVITLIKSAGFLGANEKKKPALRTAVQQHLKTVGKVEGMPAPVQRLYPPETLKQISMAQPTPPDVESLFSGVPIFGSNRIAVKLPKLGDETSTQYLSFSLSQFRDFVARLEAIGGPEGLGGNTEVPLSETYTTLKCHYTDQPVQELLALHYYQPEPKTYPLQVSGWRCDKCSLVVSEDGRKKEKLGGLNGKGIAKAKCPKCGSKFGNHPLYQIAQPVAAPSPEPVAAAT